MTNDSRGGSPDRRAATVPVDPVVPSPTRDRKILNTSEGSRPEAFGPTEWSLLIAVALIWGSSFLFITESLTGFAPGVITFGRLFLGAVFLGLVPAARRPVPRSEWVHIAALSMLWMALPLLLFPIAQQWINSSTAGMINGAVPLIAATVAAILLRRLPGRSQTIGLLIGFVGVGMVAAPGLAEGGSTLFGIVLVLIATTCYGIAINLAVPLQQRLGALPVLWRALIVAAVVTLPIGLIGLPGSDPDARSTTALFALGVLGTGVAFVAMTNLVGRAGSTRGAVAIYFVPIVAILLGVVVLDEQVAAVAIVGIAFVLLGAWLTSRPEQRRSDPAG